MLRRVLWCVALLAACGGDDDGGGGECAADDGVLFVAPGGSPTSDCTRTDPCGSIARAIEVAAPGRQVIALADGLYQEAVAITPTTYADGWPLSLVGDDATIRRPTNGPVVRLRDHSLHLERVAITGGTGATGHAIECTRVAEGYVAVTGRQLTTRDNAGNGLLSTGCTADFAEVTVEGNGGDGLRADGAPLTIDGAVIDDNGGVGVAVTGELAGLTSSWVRGNGGGGVAIDTTIAVLTGDIIAGNGNLVDGQVGGLTIAVGGAEDSFLAHLTVAENRTAAAAAGGVDCAGPLSLSSSIVWGNQGDGQIGAGCAARYTLVSGPTPSGAGNLTGEPAFVDPAAGDYDIGPGSDAIDRGDPDGSGGRDIHGDPRGDGALADLGADEYLP